MSDERIPIAYIKDLPAAATNREELRARIPGWGADLNPADRPSVPRLNPDLPATGAHWDFPDRQPGGAGRERSIEHAFLTPVFGTSSPLHGLSGATRRFGYRYSEGRLAHWMLLVVGDRVDAIGAHLRSFASLHPDNPITETGVLSELGHHPVRSRIGSTRVDKSHLWLDPLLVAGPWVASGFAVFVAGRRLYRVFARAK